MESGAATGLASLVPPVWVASHLHEPDLVVLDCSWYLPSSGRDADAEYHAAHIPGALRFDLDAASDPDTDLPHMLPSVEHFAATMENLGIRPTDRVVCYDGSGANLSAARVWWMFRVFGHRQVTVLDGGFPGLVIRHASGAGAALPGARPPDIQHRRLIARWCAIASPSTRSWRVTIRRSWPTAARHRASTPRRTNRAPGSAAVTFREAATCRLRR